MSALVLRFRANAQYLTKRYVCNSGGLYIQQNGWTDGQSRRNRSTDAATATNTSREGGIGAKNGPEVKADIELSKKIKVQFDSEVAAGGVVPVFKKALLHGNKVAIKDENGEFTYYQLYSGARKLATDISNLCGNFDKTLTSIVILNAYLSLLLFFQIQNRAPRWHSFAQTQRFIP